LLLPAGPARERYRLEHHAELSALDATEQTRYAVGALCTAWALRRAITLEETMRTSITVSKPLLCRLNLHHKWRVQHAPDGGRYRRCERCGKDQGPTGGPPDIIGGHV